LEKTIKYISSAFCFTVSSFEDECLYCTVFKWDNKFNSTEDTKLQHQ